MEVSRLDTFLTIGKQNLDRNFSLKVVNGLNSITKTALVQIKKAYAKANNISVAEGDKLYLSMSVNSGEKVLIFSGVVKHTGETSAYISIEASYQGLNSGELTETYKGISYKDTFGKLAPKLTYKAEDVTPEQIVLQGLIKESFLRLINSLLMLLKKPVYYWLTRNDTLVITHSLGGGKAYGVDNMLVSASSSSVEIFPIPELEIGDVLKFNGQEKVVQGLTFDTTGKAVVRCLIS